MGTAFQTASNMLNAKLFARLRYERNYLKPTGRCRDGS